MEVGMRTARKKAADTFPPRKLPRDVGIGFFIK